MHVAFVFDISTLTQSIYLNGRLDGSCTTSAPFMATQGDVTIGTVPLLIPVTNVNFYQVSCSRGDCWSQKMECALP